MKIKYTITKTAERLEEVPKDAEILSIDERAFYAFCEACGKPILAEYLAVTEEEAEKDIPADEHVVGEDGIYFCKDCADEIRKELATDQNVARETIPEHQPTQDREAIP